MAQLISIHEEAVSIVKKYEWALKENNVEAILLELSKKIVPIREEVFNIFARSDVDILKYTTSIPSSLFANLDLSYCFSLYSKLPLYRSVLVIPDNITSIYRNAFHGNEMYSAIVVGKNVTYIGTGVFCDSRIQILKVLNPFVDFELSNMHSLTKLEAKPHQVYILDQLKKLKCWRIPNNYNEYDWNNVIGRVNRGELPILERIEWDDKVKILTSTF